LSRTGKTPAPVDPRSGTLRCYVRLSCAVGKVRDWLSARWRSYNKIQNEYLDEGAASIGRSSSGLHSDPPNQTDGSSATDELASTGGRRASPDAERQTLAPEHVCKFDI